jgi:hypothetical protein
MLSQLFSRSTAIFRNALGYRPIARFFATCSSFPCKVCQLRVSQFWGSVQVWVPNWADSNIAEIDIHTEGYLSQAADPGASL